MSSPIPEDPYAALGVAKDAEVSEIRKAYHKLVLKHHPDRIKDEADKSKGKDEFQKVQQAYELLKDPVRRSRYDDKTKLAELRKEAMMREPAPRPMPYSMPMRSSPMQPPPREYRDGQYYEERFPQPQSTYFDNSTSKERFDEPASRGSSRKYDDHYERTERRTAAKPAEKEKEKKSTSGSSSKWAKPVNENISLGTAFGLKKKAEQARERVRDKAKEKESQAARAKERDRDERRNRTEKHKAFVVDDESDSDTATFVSQATVRPSKLSPRPKPESRPPQIISPDRNRTFRDDDSGESSDDKWKRTHSDVRDYIQRSAKRPGLSREDSDAHKYWTGEEKGFGRRSESDSDNRRPTSSKGRRRGDDLDVPKARPTPSMPNHSSAPGNLRGFVEEREPQRSSSSSQLPRDQRREMPKMERSATVPSPRASRKDNAPSKSSHLKHAETHDSGYGSSSSPHTPEMGGISPTRESARDPREAMREIPWQSSYKYQIVEPADSNSAYQTKPILIDEEDKHRRVSSPSRDRDRDRRDRDRSERDRPDRPKVVPESRTRSSRPSSTQSPNEIRPQNVRVESGRHAQPQSPRDSLRETPPVSRHNSGRGNKASVDSPVEEREPGQYSRRFPPESVSMSPRIDTANINHGSYRSRTQDDRDYFPSSKHREELRHPGGSRRPSVY